jgi:hypothetical protein
MLLPRLGYWLEAQRERTRGQGDEDNNRLGVGQAEGVAILKRRRHSDTHITATDNLFDKKIA